VKKSLEPCKVSILYCQIIDKSVKCHAEDGEVLRGNAGLMSLSDAAPTGFVMRNIRCASLLLADRIEACCRGYYSVVSAVRTMYCCE
jgi:hypothetical protein